MVSIDIAVNIQASLRVSYPPATTPCKDSGMLATILTTGTVLGIVAIGTASSASAALSADDPNCIVAPYMSDCTGQPFGTPTSPSDPSCAMDPADAVCAGGPYTAPATPPLIGSGMPGSLNADGLPVGAPPIPTTITPPGGIPGMPGTA
jgi:hypothetical protein